MPQSITDAFEIAEQRGKTAQRIVKTLEVLQGEITKAVAAGELPERVVPYLTDKIAALACDIAAEISPAPEQADATPNVAHAPAAEISPAPEQAAKHTK